ncbi:DNA glycosylase [Artemisia annua]|uniref:DNA glycosylase n=1 Tax=Artemisia annua TaxID=35608 RepID=A0A2U1P300_ARTAN|nr:DNA glycosylase [Artemisia annua]
MDIGGNGSFEGYPGQVFWAPKTPASTKFLDPNMNCENGSESMLNKPIIGTSGTSFGCWEVNTGLEDQVPDINVGLYERLLVDNVWSGMPCSDLLALGDAAVTKNSSGGVCSSPNTNGVETVVNVQFSDHNISGDFMPDSEQDGQTDQTKFLFDLNAPPTFTEAQMTTNISSQLTPETPKQTKRGGRERMVSDIISSGKDRRSEKDEQNIEEPERIIEQSHDTNWQLEAEDYEGWSSDDDLNMKKTPQLKPRRRKHRPKVVIEGQTKSARKPTTPKPDASSTGKRKHSRNGTPEISKNEPTDPIMARPKRTSCRKKIFFEDDEMYDSSLYDSTFSMSPITPDKPEIRKDDKNACSRAKRNINFSSETHDKDTGNDFNFSTGACFKEDELLTRYESLEAYLSVITNFPPIHKKKRTEKCQTPVKSRAVSSLWSPVDKTFYKDVLGFCHVETFRKKRTKGAKRMRDLTSLTVMIEDITKALRERSICREALAADFSLNIVTKKRTKRNSFVPYSAYHNHWFLTNQTGRLRWKSNYDMDELINHFENLEFIDRMVEEDEHAIVPYFEDDEHALVPCLTRFQERNGVVLYEERSLVPFEDTYNIMTNGKLRPKVEIDDETNRVWRLLLEDINSQGIDGTDEDNTKKWEEERNIYSERAASFISRMHLIQGDRRFSRWKGSIVDSVIGVYLTQNVSDHLSSSAFINLAAKYPLKSKDNNESLQEENSSTSVKEPSQLDLEETLKWNEENSNQKTAQDHGFTTLQGVGAYEVEEVDDLVSSQNSVATFPNFVQSPVSDTADQLGSWLVRNFQAELMDSFMPSIPGGSSSFKSTMLNEVNSQEEASEPSTKRIGQNILKDIGNSNEQNEGISHNHAASEALETAIMHEKHEEKCASEQSDISVVSESLATVETVKDISFQEAPKSSTTLENEEQYTFESLSRNVDILTNQHTDDNNCDVQKALGIENSAAEISEVTESIVDDSNETSHKIESNLNKHGDIEKGSYITKSGKIRKGRKTKVDWDNLRKDAEAHRKRERTPNNMDSLDYEAVRRANVNEISDTIKDRGMNNMLAERIKAFLNRLVKEHGSIDLEWLRDVPPDKAKEYLLSFRGLGLKSVECVRLLTLHHLAFPVDTNVGRIAVRLGWVPLQPLPESLQLHLLELYPILETIQQYLWPRLCKLDQKTLYELHYQMITFGKVFCTKSKPNCNSCPMRGECRHFASAFASARLALPAPEEKSIMTTTKNITPDQSPTGIPNYHHLTLPPADNYLQQQTEVRNRDPVIEVPATPEPIVEVPATPEPENIQEEFDIEDFGENPEEIPMINLNMEAFTENLQNYMENNMELAKGDMSKALVALTSETASIPTPKLKNVSQLRTEHHVYELPDTHPLLEGRDKREPDDPCSYLLAIWTPGETAESIQPPKGECSSQESGGLCHKETCFLCNSIRESNSQTVRGTLLIPCRTAMRGSFPLNGTYFQVNEVFADHDSSLNPIDVPRSWLWNLPRRTVYFGTSVSTIFRGLTTKSIQYCFWRGFICVRGFDQKRRTPRPLMARLHFPASKLRTSRRKYDEE